MGDTAAMRKRAVYPLDRIEVQNTSGSTFWKPVEPVPVSTTPLTLTLTLTLTIGMFIHRYGPLGARSSHALQISWCKLGSKLHLAVFRHDAKLETMMLFFGLGLLKQTRRSSAVELKS